MDKQTIAQKIRNQRASYSVEKRAPWDKVIHDHIIEYAQPFQIIALYCAINGEVDTYGIMESLFWDKSKIICVPKVLEDGVMKFYKIQSFQELKPGVMGILEPISTLEVEPDLVITPLSVFNSKGYRIGYGGGYYDRYFAKSNAKRVGVAYSFQYLDKDFQERHDIPCHMIVTEKEVYYEDDK